MGEGWRSGGEGERFGSAHSSASVERSDSGVPAVYPRGMSGVGVSGRAGGGTPRGAFASPFRRGLSLQAFSGPLVRAPSEAEKGLEVSASSLPRPAGTGSGQRQEMGQMPAMGQKQERGQRRGGGRTRTPARRRSGQGDGERDNTGTEVAPSGSRTGESGRREAPGAQGGNHRDTKAHRKGPDALAAGKGQDVPEAEAWRAAWGEGSARKGEEKEEEPIQLARGKEAVSVGERRGVSLLGPPTLSTCSSPDTSATTTSSSSPEVLPGSGSTTSRSNSSSISRGSSRASLATQESPPLEHGQGHAKGFPRDAFPGCTTGAPLDSPLGTEAPTAGPGGSGSPGGGSNPRRVYQSPHTEGPDAFSYASILDATLDTNLEVHTDYSLLFEKARKERRAGQLPKIVAYGPLEAPTIDLPAKVFHLYLVSTSVQYSPGTYPTVLPGTV